MRRTVTATIFFLWLQAIVSPASHQWQALPIIPDTAIAQVKAIVLPINKPLIQKRGLVVEWRPDHTIDDDEYDRDHATTDPAPADPFLEHDYDPIDADKLANLGATHLVLIAPVIELLPIIPVAAQGGYVDDEPPNEVEIEHIEHGFEHEHEEADALDDSDEGNEDQGADNWPTLTKAMKTKERTTTTRLRSLMCRTMHQRKKARSASVQSPPELHTPKQQRFQGSSNGHPFL